MKIVYVRPHIDVKKLYEELTSETITSNKYEFAALQACNDDIAKLSNDEMEYYKSDMVEQYLLLQDGNPVIIKIRDYVFVRTTDKGLHKINSRHANKFLLNNMSLLFNDKSLSSSKISATLIMQTLT